MEVYDVSYVQQHLERLIDEATQGHPFLIAVAGRPVVRVLSVSEEVRPLVRRFGFLADAIKVPDDFDRMDYGDTFAKL